jgi:dTDP-4-amino-4,6-dideoxygalactose transaminase
MSYIATANSIRYTGATVVFAEIDPLTYNLDIADVRKKITPRTKAVLLVHQLGMPADIDAFSALCQEHGLQLIEDAACAVGSSYKGKKIGSHSSLVCFSFHPRKVITTGDGGMITTDNEAYRDRLKRLRQHAMTVSDRVRHESDTVIFEDHDELGYNYRMTDIQAALGIRQLEKLDQILAGRRRIAGLYLEAFRDIPHIRLPVEPEGCNSNFQSFSIYLEPGCRITRNDLMQALLDRGISTRRGVMTAHRETAYRDYSPGLSLPVSEDASDRSIIIPLYYPMSDEEIAYVTEQVRNLLI